MNVTLGTFTTRRAKGGGFGRRTAGASYLVGSHKSWSDAAEGRGWRGREWDDMVVQCAVLVDRLRTNNRAGDDGAAELTRTLEEVTALIADDEEYVPALGAACGHDLLTRLVTHEVPEVASAAADAMEACSKHCPPGASFPARGDVDEPSHAILGVGTLANPLTLRMRHVREPEGGEKRRIPNIAWDSGLILSRWIARHPESVAGKSVLEIGAGLGAPSLTAAHRGARKVALTDVDPTAVRNAAYNAGMNLGGEVSSKITCAAHDWDDDDSYSDSDDDGAGTCSLGRVLSRAGFRFDRGGVDEGEDRVVVDGVGDGREKSHEYVTFDVVLGADVVHEQGMARGVATMLGKHLGHGPDAFAVIVNPAPAHRSGAGDLPSRLESAGMSFVKVSVTSAMLRVGVMEETEDVRLDMFLIRRKEWGEPDVASLEDVTDEWARHA